MQKREHNCGGNCNCTGSCNNCENCRCCEDPQYSCTVNERAGRSIFYFYDNNIPSMTYLCKNNRRWKENEDIQSFLF